ncbi:MAG: SDR family oxidoreductase [Myxococcales bacterium]|nr:SDR family oxidoreductase [Myxococcales bacterium]
MADREGATRRYHTALVTGGAGFIGSHIVDRLLAEGLKVRVIDDFSSGRESNLASAKNRIELLRGDLRDEALLTRAVEGCDLVFHQAAVPSVPRSVEEPLRTNSVNITGTLSLLEISRHAGVKRVVFAASSSAYGDTSELPKRESMTPRPLSPYALQKFAGEVYCRLYTELYQLETVALRYFNIYGPRQNPESEYAAVIPKFTVAALEGKSPIIYGDGGQTRDFTFVADAVEANWLAATSPNAAGKVVNIAGGRRTSLNELLSQIAAVVGSDVRPTYAGARAGDVRDSLASLDLAVQHLGYRPEVSLAEGLRETVTYFRKEWDAAP